MGSRLEPLRGDPDNLLPEGTNATDKASTPKDERNATLVVRKRFISSITHQLFETFEIFYKIGIISSN